MRRKLNLMSLKSHKRRKIRCCVRLWSRLLAAVACLVIAIGLWQWRTFSQVQARRESAEAEYEPVRKLKIENVRLRKQIAELEQVETIPLKLAEQQPLLGLVGLATQAVSERGNSLYLTQLEIERPPLTLDAKQSSELSVALYGVSLDNASAQQLSDWLRTTKLFSNVEIQTNEKLATGQLPRRAFSIQCTN